MATTPADSQIFGALFGDAELSKLFSDGAEVRAMLLVEGALAKAQGQLGAIPQDSADIIHRMARELAIDPSSLAKDTASDGVVVPALVRAFCAEMNAPEHSAFVHQGATSQDIQDTGLVLRLRRVVAILEARLDGLIADLATQARAYQSTPMAARTRHQIATPTTLGARIAGWGMPLVRHRARLAELKPRLLVVSLGGASGNRSAFDGLGLDTSRLIAQELHLGEADFPAHSARDNFVEFVQVLAGISASLGKIAQDILLSAQIGDGIRAGNGGSSSTMPHKSNPTGAETALALSRQVVGLSGMFAQAGIHAQERDGAAWSLEWLTLPQVVISTGACLRHVAELVGSLDVDAHKLAAVFEATNGLMMAEASSFALAKHLGLPEARKLVKAACAEVSDDTHLRTILEAKSECDVDWDRVFDARSATGEAETLVDFFVNAVANLPTADGP